MGARTHSAAGVSLQHVRTESLEEQEGAFLQHVIGVHFQPGLQAEVRLSGERLEKYVSRVDTVAILPAFHPFRAATRGMFEGLMLALDPAFFSEPALGSNKAGRANLRPCTSVEDTLIAHSLRAMQADMLSDSPHDSIFSESLAIGLASHLARTYAEVKLSTMPVALDDRRYRIVVEYVRANLEQRILLSDLARLVSMDVYSFIRAFKRRTSFAPHRFVMRTRAAAARELISLTRLPLAEIALRCGFSSQSHLGTVFRKHFGVSPTALRKP